MKITHALVKPCIQGLADPQWKFARAQVPRLEGAVLQLQDEDGHIGLGYVHAIPAISTHGAGALAALEFLAPRLIGRRADDIASIMEEVDATLAFNPTVKAGIDMALHDLLARRLGVPVHVLLGGKMRDGVALSRILPIKSPDEMAAIAARLAGEGYSQAQAQAGGRYGDRHPAHCRRARGSGAACGADARPQPVVPRQAADQRVLQNGAL